jgi:purine-binding chemotaxis protein CheW
VQPAPEVEIGEQDVIAGLVQVPTKAHGVEAENDSGTMVLLLDLEALKVTQHLDLAA